MTVTALPRPPVADLSAQALFREARRRRRQRWAWFTSVLAVVLIVAGVAFSRGRGSPGHPPSTAANHGGGAGTSPSPRPPNDSTGAAKASYAPVQILRSADGAVGWVAQGYQILLTTDQGRRWTTVTPPYFEGRSAMELAGPMVAVGTQDLWLPVGDLIGPTPPEPSGSVRVSGIERSVDGGRTWVFGGLPGCLQACGDMPSLSFLDAQHGFAAIGPDQDGTTLLFSTADGGVTWMPVSDMPFGGEGSSIAFTTSEDGWAISGSTSCAVGTTCTASPGGVLFRTTDGGLTWSPVSGFPAHVALHAPIFFGASDGVMLGQPVSTLRTRAPRPVVYQTLDGGATWTAHRVPASMRASAFFSPGPSNLADVPFAATSPTDWKLYFGHVLVSTTNGGRTWSSIIPRPKLASGEVMSITFSSASRGMAMVDNPRCTDPASGDCYSVLMRTTDGGQLWLAEKLP